MWGGMVGCVAGSHHSPSHPPAQSLPPTSSVPPTHQLSLAPLLFNLPTCSGISTCPPALGVKVPLEACFQLFKNRSGLLLPTSHARTHPACYCQPPMTAVTLSATANLPCPHSPYMLLPTSRAHTHPACYCQPPMPALTLHATANLPCPHTAGHICDQPTPLSAAAQPGLGQAAAALCHKADAAHA